MRFPKKAAHSLKLRRRSIFNPGMSATSATPSVRQATLDDAKAVQNILSEAFTDDPVMTWLFGDPRVVRALFGPIGAEKYLRKGFGHIAGDDAAAALWLGPNTVSKPGLMSMLRFLSAVIGAGRLSALPRAQAIADILEAHRPSEPHYYLHAVGVRSAAVGKGLGGAIIREGLKRADADNVHAYLENSNPRNTPLYERLGFQALRRLPLPDGAPPLLGMVRPPQKASS